MQRAAAVYDERFRPRVPRYFAVDGSKFSLQRSPALRRAFGVPEGAHCPQAMVSTPFDIELDAARPARPDALNSSGQQVAPARALKESARQMWRFTTRAGARRGRSKWLGRAQRSRLEPMVKVARTIREHLDGSPTGGLSAIAESP